MYCWSWHCYINNSCTQCTVGADAVISLTTLRNILLVMTLLHSLNHYCGTRSIYPIRLFLITLLPKRFQMYYEIA